MNKLFDLNNPFFSFLSKVADIIILSFLWFVCCLPVFTIGPATAALYYVALKLARKEDVQITSCFFKGFKENFWKATALWAIIAAVGSVLVIDYSLLTQLDMSNESVVWIVLIILTVLAAMIASYVLPLQAQFENPVGRTIKNAFILSIMNLPRSLYILFIKLSPVLVAFFYPEIMYILGIFCIAGIPYLETEVFVKIFAKYMPDEEEDEDDDDEEEEDDAAVEYTATPVFSSDDAETADEEQE